MVFKTSIYQKLAYHDKKFIFSNNKFELQKDRVVGNYVVLKGNRGNSFKLGFELAIKDYKKIADNVKVKRYYYHS